MGPGAPKLFSGSGCVLAGPALLFWVVAGAGCAGVNPRPEGPMVDSLEIEGTSQLPEREVKKKILTSASSFLPGWVPLLGDDQYFDASSWLADQRRIERYYQSQGYYQAKVLDDQVVQTRPGHVALEVKVREGPPTRISELKVEGLEPLEPVDRVWAAAKLGLKVGEIFRESDWADAKQTLTSRLHERGYAEAVVEGEANVELEEATAALTLTARTGPRYRFGRIFVANDPDARVPPKWIVQQVEAAITPGQWYSESALNEAQALVFQLGVFGAVKVNRGAPDRAEGTVPVVVDVREAPFRSIKLGPGLGLDSVRQEVRVLGEYSDRNFFGGLRRLTLRGKVGWAFLPTLWGVGLKEPNSKTGPVARVTTEFEQPRFLIRTLTLQATIDVSSGIEPAYDYYGGTGKLGVVWRPSPTLNVFPSYNLDVYRLGSQVPLGSQAPEALFGCDRTCVISYLEQSVEWDRRDNKLEPKSGTFLALSLQEGGLGGVFTFFRVQPEARGYLSLGEEKKLTLAAKLKAGTLLSFNENEESPIMARFFSGGSAMRGFSTRRLSPLLEVPRAGSPPPLPDGPQVVAGETVPIGGKGLVEASVEVRWNVWRELVLSLFSDTGMVTWESLGATGNQLQYLYTSVGLGARYRTPLGPIRIDLAVRPPLGGPQRLNPTGKPDPRTIDYPRNGGCFGLGSPDPAWGGQPEGICAFHLSIGEAF